jgi:hypothetical protein
MPGGRPSVGGTAGAVLRPRGSVTGWKDLPAARTADYGDLVAPYLRMMDDEIRRAIRHGSR